MINHTAVFNEWRKKYPPEPIRNLEAIHSPELKEHLEFIVSEHADFYVLICSHNENEIAIQISNYHGGGFSTDMIIPFYKEGYQLVDVTTEQMEEEEDDPLAETLFFIGLTFFKGAL
jgi:hypothetical protein